MDICFNNEATKSQSKRKPLFSLFGVPQDGQATQLFYTCRVPRPGPCRLPDCPFSAYKPRWVDCVRLPVVSWTPLVPTPLSTFPQQDSCIPPNIFALGLCICLHQLLDGTLWWKLGQAPIWSKKMASSSGYLPAIARSLRWVSPCWFLGHCTESGFYFVPKRHLPPLPPPTLIAQFPIPNHPQFTQKISAISPLQGYLGVPSWTLFVT